MIQQLHSSLYTQKKNENIHSKRIEATPVFLTVLFTMPKISGSNANVHQQTFEKAKEILNSKGIEFFTGSYSSDKNISILVSTNYKFLLTL